MTHQLHPFLITSVISTQHHRTPRVTVQTKDNYLPASLHRNSQIPPSYIDSHHHELISIPVTPHLAESLNTPGDNSRIDISTITHTVYGLTRTNHLFQSEDPSTAGHTVMPTLIPLLPNLKLMGHQVEMVYPLLRHTSSDCLHALANLGGRQLKIMV